MANQGHPSNTYSAEHDNNQAQMRKRELVDQPSDIHNQQGQTTKFLQETSAQAKDVAQTAADMARGAAVGAANMAHGAAEVVKNTLGMNATDATTTTNAAATTGGAAGIRSTTHSTSTNPITKM